MASVKIPGKLIPPVFDLQSFKGGEVEMIRRHQDQMVNPGDSGNLSVDERRGLAQSRQPGPLLGVPLRSHLVVGKDGKAGTDGIEEIALDGLAFARRRQPLAAEEELMPDRSGDRTFLSVLPELPEKPKMRRWTSRL